MEAITLVPVEESAAETIQLIERLASRDPALRAEAESTVQRGDEATISALLAILTRENKKKPRRFAAGFGFGVVLVVLLIAAAQVFAHMSIGGMVGGMTSAFLALGAYYAPTPLQKAAARALARYDDVRAVGPLCEALYQQDKATTARASEALIRLLPRLRPADSGRLSDRQRQYLNKALGTSNNRDLSCAILRAYEQVGDEKALPLVEKLAKNEKLARRFPLLHGAANECLPAIRQRAEEDHARQTLLRATSAPEDESSILLRPAQSSGVTGADLLLRPSQTAHSDR